MRKIILLTAFLFISAIGVTAFYFAKLQLPGQNTANVINSIPADAALIFEYKNDPEFYDLFRDNSLLTSFIGQKKASELAYLHQHLFKNIFNEQSVFISLHPESNSADLSLMLTTNLNEKAAIKAFIQQNPGKFKVEQIGNHDLNSISFNAIKEVLYFGQKENVIAGSFNKNLIISFLNEKRKKETAIFKPLSDQQNKNSIADLYVNYKQLPRLMNQLFINQNNDFLQLLDGFPANASLSLNYKSDALLFNGYTQTDTSIAHYLNLFLQQQPAKNTLKNVYPDNTATAVGFAFNSSGQLFKDLDRWKNPAFDQAKTLFRQIKTETGIAIKSAFRKQIANEFAVITTSGNEKLAVIQLKNGSETYSFLQNLSISPNADWLQLKYLNLPFYLLGEPLRSFKQPYFAVLDNFLFLAETENGLNQYLKKYHQQQFLNTTNPYLNFDALQSAQSNVTFFADFVNAGQLLQNTLRPAFASAFKQPDLDWNTYYAMAIQFTASDNGFYTNFYLQQKQRDTADNHKEGL